MKHEDSELSMLFEFGRQVSASLSVEHVIAAALDGIMRVVAPDFALLYRRQGEKLAVSGVRPEEASFRDLGSEVKAVGECLCGLAAQDHAVYSYDIHADSRCIFDECRRLGTKSFAAIPLVAGEGASGVIAIASLSERDFSVHAVFLEALAGFTATALENAINQERLETHARELRMVNDALRASENRYRTVVDDMPALVCRFLPDGTLTFVNDRYCEYFDKTREELEGRNFFLFIPEGDRDFVVRHYTSLTPEKPAITYEHKVLAPDGTLRWQRWTDRALFDGHRRPIEYQSMGEDITGRKRAENRIVRLNRLYAVLSSINHAIVRIRDKEELFGEACRIAVDVGGFRMAWVGVIDEGTGRVKAVAHAGVTGDYLDVVDSDMGDDVRGNGPTGSALREKLRVICNDIEKDALMAPWRQEALRLGYRASAAFPLMVENDVIAVLNIYSGERGFFDDEEVRLLDGLSMDMSFALEFMEREQQRLRAEEALRSAEEKYRKLVEQVPAVSYTAKVDENSETIYVSPQIVRLLGFSMEQWKADPKLWMKQLHSEDRPRVVAEMAASHGSASPFTSEYRMVTADGSTVWIRDEATLITNESGRPLFLQGVMLDISDRKKLEAQLVQAQKMEAVGHLAGGIAHDFNNILTAIIGYASLIRMRLGPDDPLQPNAEQILSAAERAATLTRSLLAYSRKQHIEPKPLNLNDAVTHLKKMLVRVIGEDIALKTVLSEKNPVVMADRGQVEQVIMNLATNARDAMPDGGDFLIATDEVVIDEEYVKGHDHGTPGRYALLSFTDTGVGMDEYTKARVFEPFYTTKEVGKGTGLGLAMVYGAVRQHHGIIDVSSEPGKGTTFRIFLPLVSTDGEGEAAREADRPPAGTETILVAEDDDILRTLTKEALAAYGYRIIEAVDGEDAVAKFRENAGLVDLLLLDVIMPKLNGREVYEVAKALKPAVRALFTSGYSENLIHEKGIFGEGTSYLCKPFTPRLLLRRLRDVLDSPETSSL